jgi:hypothetical protein
MRSGRLPGNGRKVKASTACASTPPDMDGKCINTISHQLSVNVSIITDHHHT